LVLPIGLSALGLLTVFAASPAAQNAFFSRFSTFEDLDKDKSYLSRLALNQKCWRLFSESPVFGVGPGRFRQIYVPLDLPGVLQGHSDERINRKSSHNSYLSFLAEGGCFGALPLAALLVTLAARGAFAAILLNRKGEHCALAVYCSFIAMSVHF